MNESPLQHKSILPKGSAGKPPQNFGRKSLLYFFLGILSVLVGVLANPPIVNEDGLTATFPFGILLGAVAAMLLFARGVYHLLPIRDAGHREDVSALLKQFDFIVYLTALSFAILSGFFLADGILSGDTRMFYSYFHDHFHSLNAFGEPAWWAPEMQHTGAPNYFYGLLGHVNNGSPLSLFLGFIFWVLGKLGIQVEHFLPLYYWYLGAIVPFLFNLAVWYFSIQLSIRSPAIYYVLILSAFSPGVIANHITADLLESAAYGIFYGAAYLAFIRNPSKRNFLAFLLTAAVLGLTLNFSSLFFCFPFLLSLLLATLIIKDPEANLLASIRKIPARHWLLFAFVFLVCASPNLITYSQKGEIVRQNLGSLEYDWKKLQAGNPMEPFFASLPGVGFNWLGSYGDKMGVRTPAPMEAHYSFYLYLGIMALPLTIWGLMRGPAVWRLRLFFMFLVFFGIFILSGQSPIYMIMAQFDTPLRSMDHYVNMTYITSGFLLLILTSGLGLQQLVNNFDPAFKKVFLGWLVFSVALYYYIYEHYSYTKQTHKFELNTTVGFLALMLFLNWIIIQWWGNAGTRKNKNPPVFFIFLLVTLLDVATIGYWHVRFDIPWIPYTVKVSYKIDKMNPPGLGLTGEGSQNAWISLKLKSHEQDFEKVPTLSVFSRAHPANIDKKVDLKNTFSGRSLGINNYGDHIESLKDFFRSAPDKPGSKDSFRIFGQTFNDYKDRIHFFFDDDILELESTNHLKKDPEDVSDKLQEEGAADVREEDIEQEPNEIQKFFSYYQKKFRNLIYGNLAEMRAIGKIDMVHRTYNSYEMEGNFSSKVILLLRNAHFPGWRAWVNGQEIPVLKAVGHLTAFVLPEGNSKILVKFRPAFVGEALMVAALTLMTLMALWVHACFKPTEWSAKGPLK